MRQAEILNDLPLQLMKVPNEVALISGSSTNQLMPSYRKKVILGLKLVFRRGHSIASEM